jgi:predicted nucleic acid-binding protein
MRILVDTGVWLRVFDRAAPERAEILRCMRHFWSGGHELATTAQNVAEFWNVSTRPVAARGGCDRPISIVEPRVRQIERPATVLPFTNLAYQQWRQLLVNHGLIGVAVHDARIAAVMMAEGIQYLFTLNGADFRRYAGITVIARHSDIHF